MSLLYDARRIQNGGVIEVNDRCYFCGYDLAGDDPHAPDCPWLSMPQIMATLEAAEALLAPQFDEPKMDTPQGEWFYVFCTGPAGRHEPDCRWQALIAALRGIFR